MEYTITLPKMVTFKRAGEDRTFDIEGLAGDIIEELVIHGLTQKIGDAAAGKSGDDATAAMQKVHDALMRGDWGVKRSGGGGFDEVQRAMISFVRPKMRGAIGGYKDMTAAERDAAIWSKIEEQSETAQASIRKHAEGLVATAKAEREALKGLDLDL